MSTILENQTTYKPYGQRQQEEYIQKISELQARRTFQQLQALDDKKKRFDEARTAGQTVLNPYDKKVYVAKIHGNQFKYNEPIVDMRLFQKAKQIAKDTAAQGSIGERHWNKDQLMFKMWNNQWEGHAAEWMHILNQMQDGIDVAENAAIITSGDYSALNTINIYGDLLDLEMRDYTLPQAVTNIPTNEIDIRIDNYNRFSIDEDLGELERPTSRMGRVTSQTFTLRKAVGFIEYSDESQMRTKQYNMIEINRQNAISDLPRVKAGKIATVLLAATGVISGNNWATWDTGTEHNLYDPDEDIATAQDQIFTNYGMPDTIIMNSKTWRRRIKNTNVKGSTAPNPALIGVQSVVVNSAGQLGRYTVYLDETIPTGTVFVFKKSIAFLLQGPVKVETGRDGIPGSSWFKISDWHGANVQNQGMLRKITGVAT